MSEYPKTTNFYTLFQIPNTRDQLGDPKVKITKFDQDWNPASSYVMQATERLGVICNCPARTTSCRHLKILAKAHELDIFDPAANIGLRGIRFDDKAKIAYAIQVPAEIYMEAIPEAQPSVSGAGNIDIFED